VVLLTAAPPGQAGEAGGAFVKIDGREALLRGIELFLNRDPVKQIQLVLLADNAEEIKRRHGAHFSFSGVKVTTGGPLWIDQIAAAAANLKPEATHVILHDAARPAVPYTDIEAIMEEAERGEAAALITPVRTSLVELDEGTAPIAYHRPDRFMQLLTPQVYARARFERMAREKQEVHASELRLIKGSPLNQRLAGPGDATLVKAMLSMLPKPKKGALGAFEEAQW
jgi:2-C-methyl-D-erythritol 4-phosphate cytidylyltransferase